MLQHSLHIKEEWTHLYSTVAPVSYNDVSIGVHGHTSWSVELAIAFSMGAKFEKELAVSVVDLEQLEWPQTLFPTHWSSLNWASREKMKEKDKKCTDYDKPPESSSEQILPSQSDCESLSQ